MHYYPNQAINVADVSFNNLNNSSGWALLGNPFSSAIDWNQGTWNRLNISSPQVYNEDMRSFEPVTVIPSTNGFWVQVTGPINGITIPANSRKHDPQTWYKSESNSVLKLQLSGDQDLGYDKTSISFNDHASEGFDQDLDFYKMRSNPIVPQIFTLNEDAKEHNTLAIQQPNNEKIIPLNVHIGYDGIYKIEVIENTTIFESPIYLKDKKTGDLINLSNNPEYSFTGTLDEAEDRFLLYFNSSVGIDETDFNDEVLVFTQNQNIHISMASEMNDMAYIYDLSGKLIHSFPIQTKTHIENTRLIKGAYILKFANHHQSQKFIIH
jgi:hypothetical protein